VSVQEANWKFAEDYPVPSAPLAKAGRLSAELGIECVSPSVGSALAVAAAASRARAIAEIGTGVGVSGLWLLTGAPEATLTTIDAEPEHLQQAKAVFAEAGVPATRVRAIGGAALTVLPRMNDESYDLVLVDADPEKLLEYVEHALRLVRVSGSVLIPHVLRGGRVADPVKRDALTTDVRTLLEELAVSPAVLVSLSPVGDGLLHIHRRA